MKNLLFYTFHRHLDEIYYSSLFFNKSDFMKNNFDVLLHCNNKNHSLEEIKKRTKFETNVNIVLTDKNEGGYVYGIPEAQSDLYGYWKQYPYVLFSQLDCYMVSDKHFKNIFDSEFDAFVSPIFHIGKICYIGDFFMLQPKSNIFFDWKNHMNTTQNNVHEHYLADCINSEYKKIKTCERKGHIERQIDSYGLWHEHDNSKVEKVLGLK